MRCVRVRFAYVCVYVRMSVCTYVCASVHRACACYCSSCKSVKHLVRTCTYSNCVCVCTYSYMCLLSRSMFLSIFTVNVLCEKAYPHIVKSIMSTSLSLSLCVTYSYMCIVLCRLCVCVCPFYVNVRVCACTCDVYCICCVLCVCVCVNGLHSVRINVSTSLCVRSCVCT